MSLGIYPVFQPKLKGTKFDALGEVLAANVEALDKIARSANLTPFTAFADNRPVPEDFDGDPDELAEVMGGGPPLRPSSVNSSSRRSGVSRVTRPCLFLSRGSWFCLHHASQ